MLVVGAGVNTDQHTIQVRDKEDWSDRHGNVGGGLWWIGGWIDV